MSKTIGNYVLIKPIGSGQYGNVYLGKNLKTDKIYAIKELSVQNFAKTPNL